MTEREKGNFRFTHPKQGRLDHAIITSRSTDFSSLTDTQLSQLHLSSSLSDTQLDVISTIIMSAARMQKQRIPDCLREVQRS